MNYLKQIYKGETHWWRWLFVFGILLPPFLKSFLWDYILEPLREVLPKGKYISMALSLSVSMFLLIIFYVLFKYLHKRQFITLITSRKKVGWMRFWLGFSIWGLLSMLVFSFSVISSPEDYQWNFSLIPFLKLFVVSVVFMSVKAFYITVLMKGYVLQGATYFLKKPWLSLLVVVALFSFFMYKNQSEQVGLMGNHILVHFIATSILLGVITILDDGLEIVLGMTLANDLISELFITSRSYAVHTDSILIQESSPDIMYMIYVTVFFMYPMCFYLLNKVYKWGDWRKKFFDSITS